MNPNIAKKYDFDIDASVNSRGRTRFAVCNRRRIGGRDY